MEWGDERYAGLLYAPWIHEEVVVNTDEVLETIFYLFIINGKDNWNLYVYYLHYTPDKAVSPMMAIINPSTMIYRFSISSAESIWDEKQWSEEYIFDNEPENLKDERFIMLNSSIQNIIK